MGYNVNIFVDEIDDNLLCSICGQVLEGAVLTPCGHSFCESCLDRWLTRPDRAGLGWSCPHCRSVVLEGQSRPILSLRNFILSLRIRCTNEGCTSQFTVEGMDNHNQTCGHSEINCAGCNASLKRHQLPDHQTQCSVISDLVNGRPEESRNCELFDRVSNLEKQIQQMKDELKVAEHKNAKLGSDLLLAKQELEERRQENMMRHTISWDTSYNYGYTSESISKLASLLLRYSHQKPCNIDADRVFECVRRCYDNFGHNRKIGLREPAETDNSSNAQERVDVHMLVATAQACDWFNENQRLNLHCWVQSIARHQQLKHIQTYG